MKTGLIVYNLTQTNEKFMTQIDAFVAVFAKMHIKLLKTDNFFIEKYLAQNKKIPFVLFYDKDVALALRLESLKIAVFNHAETIRLCDDKGLTYLKLLEEKIPMPKTTLLPYLLGKNLYDYYEDVKEIFEEYTYPFILKERVGSFGDQVYLINNPDELKAVLRICGDKPLLIQEFVACSRGRDIRAFVIGNKVDIAVQRVNENDFRSNVNQGGVMSLYKKTNKIKKIALKAAAAVGADFAGVDIVFNEKKKPLVLEVNSNPRTLSIKDATKYDPARSMAKYIKKHLKNR